MTQVCRNIGFPGNFKLLILYKLYMYTALVSLLHNEEK